MMILDEEVLGKLQTIKNNAMAHPVSPTQLLTAGKNNLSQEQGIRIEPGYFLFFTVEKFPDGKYYGQLSVSSVGRRQPDASIDQMETLAMLLGLGDRTRWTVSLEPAKSGLRAYNVFAQVY